MNTCKLRNRFRKSCIDIGGPYRTRPDWAKGGKQLTRLTTTDAEFSCPIVEDTKAAVRRVCWRDGRGRWREAEVLWARVRDAA